MPAPRSPAKRAYNPQSRGPMQYYRWKPHPSAQPHNTQCTGNNATCPNPVSLRICRGTTDPLHAGYYYEACDPVYTHPGATHFIGWREDLGRARVPARLVARRTHPDASLADIVHGNDVEEEEFLPFPSTPSKISTFPRVTEVDRSCGSYYAGGETPVEEIFQLDHPATPTIKRHIDMPAENMSEEDALKFSTYLDSIEEEEEELFKSNTIPPPSSGHKEPACSHPSPTLFPAVSEPPTMADSASTEPCSARSSPTPSAPTSSIPWKVGTKTERCINGKVRSICAGKGCEKREIEEGKEPSKAAQQCSFLFCKPCCDAYRAETGEYCKTHKDSVSQPQTRTAGPSLRAPKAIVGLPLKQVHYERRETAIQDYRQDANAIISRKVYEDEESKRVDITFWDDNGIIHEFSEMSRTFPIFKLADCAQYVRDPIGPNPEVFFSDTGRWRRMNSEMPRRLVTGEMVLYRAPGAYGQSYKLEVPKEMQDAMDEQHFLINSNSKGKSKVPALKRKASHSELEIPRPVNRPRLELPLQSSSSIPVLDLDNDSRSPSLSLSTPNPVNTVPPLKSPPPTIPTSSTALQPFLSERPLTEQEKLTPHSAKAPWPLKYFQPMFEGIRKIDNMSGGQTEREKHSRAFPTSTASAATLARQMRFWFAASEGLRNEFYAKPRATWKEFCETVEKIQGGKVPGLKAQKQSKAKGKQREVVKAEDWEASAVRVKQEEEAIVIHGSDSE
ncbi:hypothetical protein V5O48_017807 [Marasmius crinis-equi]|uniref:Uncharacterized protein n=1 Tax=Marasmius crinis-equi TaxID=585013 RepID=A0ABR3EMY6_9AGAR